MARGLRGSELPPEACKTEGSGTVRLRRYPTSISDLVNKSHPLNQKLRMMPQLFDTSHFFKSMKTKLYPIKFFHLILFLFAFGYASGSDRPNVLFIVSDDHGW